MNPAMTMMVATRTEVVMNQVVKKQKRKTERSAGTRPREKVRMVIVIYEPSFFRMLTTQIIFYLFLCLSLIESGKKKADKSNGSNKKNKINKGKSEKADVNSKNDEDSGEDDPFGGMSPDLLNKQVGKLRSANNASGNTGGKLLVTMHKYVHTTDGRIMALVMLGNLGSTVYYLKAEHVQEVCILAHTLNHPDDDIPTWIHSIKEFHLRSLDGKDVYIRTGNNKTRRRIGFSVVVPAEKLATLENEVSENLAYMFRCFKLRKSKDTPSAGQLCYDYIDGLPKGDKGGLIENVLTKFCHNPEFAVNTMDVDLDERFKHGHFFEYDKTWDCHLINHDIREELKSNLHINGWDELTPDSYKSLFKDYSKKKKLPNWNLLHPEQVY